VHAPLGGFGRSRALRIFPRRVLHAKSSRLRQTWTSDTERSSWQTSEILRLCVIKPETTRSEGTHRPYLDIPPCKTSRGVLICITLLRLYPPRLFRVPLSSLLSRVSAAVPAFSALAPHFLCIRHRPPTHCTLSPFYRPHRVRAQAARCTGTPPLRSRSPQSCRDVFHPD